MDDPKPTWTVKPKLRGNARELRKNSTQAERLLWASLRDHRLSGLSVRRQVPIYGYIADFVCHAAKLVIELDGGQHYSDVGEKADAVRTVRMARSGFRVLRFSNHEVMMNRDGISKSSLPRSMQATHPNRPPRAGEGTVSPSGRP